MVQAPGVVAESHTGMSPVAMSGVTLALNVTMGLSALMLVSPFGQLTMVLPVAGSRHSSARVVMFVSPATFLQNV